MVQSLGTAVSRGWPLILLAWCLLAGVVNSLAPHWSSVSIDGEFIYLPSDAPSRVAETMYRRAFPNLPGDDQAGSPIQQDPLSSNIVILVRRMDLPGGLTNEDLEFIETKLRPALEEIARTSRPERRVGVESEAGAAKEADRRIARGVWTWADPGVGALLTSDDNRATLVLMELETEFLDPRNSILVQRVERLVRDVTRHENWGRHRIAGLDFAISGSAAVGRDVYKAEYQSAANTDWITPAIVLGILLIIFRAPLLAVIPVVTGAVAVNVSIRLLRMLAEAGWIQIFQGVENYVTVVNYALAGCYGLLLIALYSSELERGVPIGEAVSAAVRRGARVLSVGAMVTAGCAVAMAFAQFGKFQQAGLAIGAGIVVVLIAVLSWMPSLLMLAGRWAFWPDIRAETIAPDAAWRLRLRAFTRLKKHFELEAVSRVLDDRILRQPAGVVLGCVAALAPFAAAGWAARGHLNYSLLADLPQEEASVEGAIAIQRHFAAGVTGPTTVMITSPHLDIPVSTDGLTQGEIFSGAITTSLSAVAEELNIADIRSQKAPLGSKAHISGLPRPAARGILRSLARRIYLSEAEEFAGRAMRLDLVFKNDPFSRQAIEQLTGAEAAIREALPEAYFQWLLSGWENAQAELEEYQEPESGESEQSSLAAAPIEQLRETADKFAAETSIWSVGPTASIRDVKHVTDGDQLRVAGVVLIIVGGLTLLTLRSLPVMLALTACTVLGYFATLGATFLIFWLREPSSFAGLDWKVPVFLFSLLLGLWTDEVMRVIRLGRPETRDDSPADRLRSALIQWSGLMTRSGVVIAGAFLAMVCESLYGLIQLGFGMAIGVLLNNFVLRPLLIPSLLALGQNRVTRKKSTLSGPGLTAVSIGTETQ